MGMIEHPQPSQLIGAWPDYLSRLGEMGKRVREFDWSGTPLGAIESWPQSLRSATQMVLSGSFPMALHWGAEYIQIYNDAMIPTLGYRHPVILGRSVWETWQEHLEFAKSMLNRVHETGLPVLLEDIPNIGLQRFGYLDETFTTCGYSPFFYEDAKVSGGFVTLMETTQKVLSERRLKTLQTLAEHTVSTRDPDEVCRIAANVLASNNADVPFTLIYLLDEPGRILHLAGINGIEANQPVSPITIQLSELNEAEEWPLNKAMSGGPLYVQDLESRFDALPGGSWPEPSREGLILPLMSRTQERAIGVMVMGISPRLHFEEKYREFFTLAAAQIETAIGNAHAYAQERKRAEMLDELDRAKTTFFSNVSHEFRTPLTLILGPAIDALRDMDTIPENRIRLNIIHRSTLRLLKLVNSLLDFSRIEAGRFQALYRPVDLAAFTAELASNFRSAMEKAGLTFIVNCPPLPEPIYVDVEMWEKIVLNLISNAFKNTFAGKIEVSLTWHGDHALFSVRDTGIGIAEEHLSHLFERFYRIPDTRARTQEGAGIGLSMVKELVNLHGGRIHVESAVGAGSTFTVSIPAGYAHLPGDRLSSGAEGAQSSSVAQPFIEEALGWLPQEPEAEEIEASPPGESPAESIPPSQRPKRSRVLLVDDNRDMRSYVQRLLKPYYDVIAMPDGQAALEWLSENKADLVLTDIMMPCLDGFGLLKAIRGDDNLKTMPVIMLSARAGEEASVEGLTSGADDYLIKPFNANELLARVRTHLEMVRIRHESEEALRQAQKMEVVGQLAGGAAHDFNSLLAVIMGRLQLLKGYIPNDEAAQRSLEAACHTAERASKLIRQLLAFARKQPLNVKAVSLNELITDMDNLLQNALRENIHLERNLAGNLWQALVDTTQIQLALLNLSLNARDAMPEGGLILMTTRNMRIDETLENVKPADLKAGEYVVLSVTDTGTGMSEEVLARAFEPFFTTKDIGAGSGLGLSQVYGTAKQLGGTARIKSAPKQGTTVEIILPRARDNLSPPV